MFSSDLTSLNSSPPQCFPYNLTNQQLHALYELHNIIYSIMQSSVCGLHEKAVFIYIYASMVIRMSDLSRAQVYASLYFLRMSLRAYCIGTHAHTGERKERRSRKMQIKTYRLRAPALRGLSIFLLWLNLPQNNGILILQNDKQRRVQNFNSDRPECWRTAEVNRYSLSCALRTLSFPPACPFTCFSGKGNKPTDVTATFVIVADRVTVDDSDDQPAENDDK